MRPALASLRVDRIRARLEERRLFAIVQDACDECDVPVDDVLGERRLASLCATRHLVWFYLYRETRLSYPEIGRIFEVDHTTVLSAVHRIADRYSLPMNKKCVRDPVRNFLFRPAKCESSGPSSGGASCA